ncbi:MAG TPA: SCE4755 family polysaccharide monooxygenase-like protein [Bryobacteraceae bacterium]|nr:SCE4755 family polysaccharide monooxygenase-like protein [Bryobacteraceae bacterium]
MKTITILLGGCLLFALAQRAVAHFRLLEPASWLQESDLGDPQWSPPCGGTLTDPGKPTGAITKIQGGEKLHIRIREMAFHPGFYRVALAVNSRAELPPDPEAISEPGADGRQHSVSAAIHYPPVPPVLADGLFMHVARFDKDQETDVEIPNINCEKCTLQVIEFMGAHGFNKDGGYTYHHCAVLQIHANPNKPVDTRFPAETTQP